MHAEEVGPADNYLKGKTLETITINYSSPTLTAVDDLIQTDGDRVVRFNPLVNDEVTGQLRTEWNISTVVSQTLNVPILMSH